MEDFNGNNKGPRSPSLACYPFLYIPAVLYGVQKEGHLKPFK